MWIANSQLKLRTGSLAILRGNWGYIRRYTLETAVYMYGAKSRLHCVYTKPID